MRIVDPIPHKKARIEIIPLIDIMFFLLASFMMVSLSQVHMKGIKVNLPTGVSGETQNKREYVSLSVDKDGYFYFDKKQIEFDQVLPQLQAIYAISPDAKVFVRGDRDALHGNVIRLLNQIRSSGYNRIAFEIKSEGLKAVPAPGVQLPPSH
jgi:biopolymer transport protein ExbD